MNTDIYRPGELYRSESGRWALNGVDLTCGSSIEVSIAGRWIDIFIEHDGDDYYAIPPAVHLHEGLFARFRSEWAE
jgi:hypothetical protein